MHVELLDVGQLDLQAVGAAAVVAEVDLTQRLGGDSAQLLLGGARGLGVEEPRGEVRGQSEGEVAQPGVVGRAGLSGEPEPDPGVDHQTGTDGGLASGLLTDAGLPAGADRVGQAFSIYATTTTVRSAVTKYRTRTDSTSSAYWRSWGPARKVVTGGCHGR